MYITLFFVYTIFFLFLYVEIELLGFHIKYLFLLLSSFLKRYIYGLIFTNCKVLYIDFSIIDRTNSGIFIFPVF